MSAENVEVVRSTFEAWNAGDMDAIRDLYDPAIVVRYAEGWPEGLEPALGREAVMRWYDQLRETWDANSLDLISLINAGDRVIARQILRGVGQGPDLNLEVTSVATLRKGKVILIEFFWDHADALETLGLSDKTMPEENLEIVRSIYAGWERGDFSSAKWANPEIEFVIADSPEPGRWTGLAAMANAWRDFLSAWGDFRAEADEFRELDDERILVLDHRVGRGKTSGADLLESGAKGASLFCLRDAKVTRLVVYGDAQNALAEVDLAE
jgi:ketosteroid isomerase-like protein